MFISKYGDSPVDYNEITWELRVLLNRGWAKVYNSNLLYAFSRHWFNKHQWSHFFEDADFCISYGGNGK